MNSVVLNHIEEACFAESADKDGCLIMVVKNDHCGTCECPFFKPKGCGDWIRKQKGRKTIIVPPEEYYGAKT